MTGRYSQQGNQCMDDIRSYGAMAMMDALGIDAAIAEQVANEIAYRLSEHWGGSMIYITKNTLWQARQRDQEIIQAFTGHNHHELSKQFGLSLQYIYTVLARARKQQQPNLF